MKAFFLLIALVVAPAVSVAESPLPPVDLAKIDAWEEKGKWATAETIKGSSSAKEWKSVKPGDKILYNGREGKTDQLVSKQKFGDVEVEVEFMIPKGSNSGIYLMQRYELQILDSYGKADGELRYGDNGGVYERWDEKIEGKDKGYEGTPPTTNASTAPGTWQTFLISFRAPRFDADGKKIENARFIHVEHNGVVIHQDVEVTGPTRGGKGGPEVNSAPLAIQGDHGPVAFKELLVRPASFK